MFLYSALLICYYCLLIILKPIRVITDIYNLLYVNNLESLDFWHLIPLITILNKKIKTFAVYDNIGLTSLILEIMMSSDILTSCIDC